MSYFNNKIEKRTFTMVELLAVMAIIMVLAGIGVGAYSYSMTKIKISRTEALVKRIETALVAVKEKHGFFPQSFDTSPSPKSYVFLVQLNSSEADTDHKTISPINYPKGYFEEYKRIVDLESLQKSTKDGLFVPKKEIPVAVDAWGNPIYYRCPGRKNPSSFDLFSAGPDGNVGNTGKALWKKDSSGVELNSGITDSNDIPLFDTRNADDIGR